MSDLIIFFFGAAVGAFVVVILDIIISYFDGREGNW